MDRSEIKTILPHREPMLLIDSVELDAEGVAHAQVKIPEDPFYCQGHFPGNPVVPGVILCEMMAQSCFALFPEAFEENLLVYRGLDQVRFRGIVRPGDVCEVQARLLEHKASLYEKVCTSGLENALGSR